MSERAKMMQTAPYPSALASLVERLAYRPGWRCWLEADTERDRDSEGRVVGRGLTLVIVTQGYNSYKPSDGETYRVHHYFIVPAATYDERAWMRWLFDQVVLVETHEAMEFFKIDKHRPYAPNHGPGRNPYTIHERGTEKDAHTRFTGQEVHNRGTV
jgi:hypothetical protein